MRWLGIKNIVDDLLRRTGLFRDLQSQCLQELHREIEMENRNIVEDLIVSILVDFVFQSLGEDVDHVFSSLGSVDRLVVHFVLLNKKQKKTVFDESPSFILQKIIDSPEFQIVVQIPNLGLQLVRIHIHFNEDHSDRIEGISKGPGQAQHHKDLDYLLDLVAGRSYSHCDHRLH